MKLIIAIIPSHHMESVIAELNKIHVFRKTVSNVLGVGKSHREVYRGLMETGDLVKKIKFEIAVDDGKVEEVLKAFADGTHNDEQDGKIFILNIEECIQLGTSHRGSDAVGQ
jgi:nitrogen regulatory protein PII